MTTIMFLDLHNSVFFLPVLKILCYNLYFVAKYAFKTFPVKGL